MIKLSETPRADEFETSMILSKQGEDVFSFCRGLERENNLLNNIIEEYGERIRGIKDIVSSPLSKY